MKNIFCLLGALFLYTQSYAQEIAREDLLPIFTKLGSEDWDNIFSMANDVIATHPSDTASPPRELLNYICILSGAGKVSKGSMTHDELEQYTNRFIGQPIRMAAHPTTTDTSVRHVMFNTNRLEIENDTVKGSCQTTNKVGSTILCFEYYTFTERFGINDYEGKSTRWGGVLESVDVNPNKSTLWILRLRIKDAWPLVFQPVK